MGERRGGIFLFLRVLRGE